MPDDPGMSPALFQQLTLAILDHSAEDGLRMLATVRSFFMCVRERSTGSRIGERLGWPWRKQYGPLGLWDGVPMALRAGNRRGRPHGLTA